MKVFRFIFFPLIVSLSWFIGQSQIPTAKEVYGLKRIETPRFFPKSGSPVFVYMPMDFNEDRAEKLPESFDPQQVVSVSLIYTQYKLSERFDQLELNTRRTRELFSKYPELKNAPGIRWYWIAQTGCNEPGACRDYFHGFEIRLRSDEEIRASEKEAHLIDFYTALYSGAETDTKYLDSLVEAGSSIQKMCDTTYVTKAMRTNTHGMIMDLHPKSKTRFVRKVSRKITDSPEQFSALVDQHNRVVGVEGLSGADSLEMLKLLNRHFRFYTARYQKKRVCTRFRFDLSAQETFQTYSLPLDRNWETIPSFEDSFQTHQRVSCYFVDTLGKRDGVLFGDHTVINKVLDRNMSNWKDAIIVTDVTGSMYPYLGQFLAWHKLHLNSGSKNTDFVFFNDGDNMPDYLKKSGNIGGTYYIKTQNYDELRLRVQLAQRNGDGGDGPENNVEAALYGLSQYPQAREIIMIADNWATPRDLELLGKVKRPIRLIVCGASNGFNVDYLNMIRKNGGSLHTIEHDLMHLAKLSEGEEIEIEGRKYQIQSGVFKPVMDLSVR